MSAAQTPPPRRCAHRTRTRRTPSRLGTGAQGDTKGHCDTAHAGPSTCKTSRWEGSLGAQALQIKACRFAQPNPFCPGFFCLLTSLTLLPLTVYPHEQPHQTETCTLPTPSESCSTPMAGSHHKLQGLKHPPPPPEEEISPQSP